MTRPTARPFCPLSSTRWSSGPPIDDPEDVAAWREGEGVELIYGLQGSIMLVVEVVARQRTDRGFGPPGDDALTGLPALRPDDIHGRLGCGGATKLPQQPGVPCRGRLLVPETVLLPFEMAPPAEGEALDLRPTLGCLEIQRTLIAHLPEE
jgi:hypothetical protein